MEKVQTFVVEPFERKPDQVAYARLLRRSGGDTGTIVPGVDLEAELEYGGEHLLFLTHDIPFEEGLEILLIDRMDKLVDRVSLYAAYTSGIFSNLVALPGPAAEFDFYEATRWRITVFDRPRLFIPFVGILKGIHRELGVTSRLGIQRLPQGG